MGVLGTIIKALANPTVKRLIVNSLRAAKKVPNTDELLGVFCADFAERGYMICSLPDDDTDPLAAVFVWRQSDYQSPALQRRLQEMRRQGFRVTVGVMED